MHCWNHAQSGCGGGSLVGNRTDRWVDLQTDTDKSLALKMHCLQRLAGIGFVRTLGKGEGIP